ncbi:MAG: flagellar basal body rod protein FlgC [Desulfosarcinaceae bacterium]|jgi:flagellar basal-body rod protein FlgC
MDFMKSLDVSAAGLNAQRIRMNLISHNLANVNTTRTAEGGPYKRKDALFETVEPPADFKEALHSRMEAYLRQVQVSEIREDNRPPIRKYDPTHPDADESGYVSLPNINVVEEMVNMMSASRSYEANVTAVKTTKDMAMTALEIGR